MTMTFSLHESIEPNHAFEHMEQWTETRPSHSGRPEEFHLILQKLRAPRVDDLVERPRLTNLALRSQSQFPATLITGRSGTGKTAVAAAVAAQNNKTAWYTVESTERDWSMFSRYFSASLSAPWNGAAVSSNVSQNEIAAYLVRLFSSGGARPIDEPTLIVLDDIHHIFDAPWFAEFFNLLLYSLPAKTHLLLLCRSKPPAPLWRLRSKQMLNVLDEKDIAFTASETESLFDRLGVPAFLADQATQDSFGRVSKLLEFARERSTILPPAH